MFVVYESDVMTLCEDEYSELPLFEFDDDDMDTLVLNDENTWHINVG